MKVTILLQYFRVILSLLMQSNFMGPLPLALFQGASALHSMSASLLQCSLRTLQVDALIEAFYHLDESVKGEFLSMQMSKGLRGDIQEIADRAGVPALSCRRQFENLKRISKGRTGV